MSKRNNGTTTKPKKITIYIYLQRHPEDDPVVYESLIKIFQGQLYTEEEWVIVLEKFWNTEV